LERYPVKKYPVKRDKIVMVRLTSDEKQALKEQADKNRRSLSDFLRVTFLEAYPHVERPAIES
jgi:uncharacterized protein (DUF1778 family)